MKMRLFLGSGGYGTKKRRQFLRRELDSFLGNIDCVLFIPYALADYDEYVRWMVKRKTVGKRKLYGIHRFRNPIEAIKKADAIFVGGGNTFRLIHTLQEKNLIPEIRRRVLAGMPYVGVSAGTNVAAPTMMTTNDMPIVQPASFKALGLVPFQINPHYFGGPTFTKQGGKLIPYAGETRDDRIREFHEMNKRDVLGLWEGTILRIEDGKARILGVEGKGARWFRKGKKPKELSVNSILPRPLYS